MFEMRDHKFLHLDFESVEIVADGSDIIPAQLEKFYITGSAQQVHTLGANLEKLRKSTSKKASEHSPSCGRLALFETGTCFKL